MVTLHTVRQLESVEHSMRDIIAESRIDLMDGVVSAVRQVACTRLAGSWLLR